MNSTDSAQQVYFQPQFEDPTFVDPPVVLSQAQTVNNDVPIVTRNRTIYGGYFYVELQPSEVAYDDGLDGSETVGVIAIGSPQ